MTLELWATQSGSFSAELTRRALFMQYARTSSNSPGILAGGLASATDLAPSAPASGLSCQIAPGEAIVGGTEGGSQGAYYFRNSATYSAPISAADPSNPRIDAIVITAADSGYTEPSDAGGTSNGGVIATITGTPTAGATLSNGNGAPSTPASSLLIAWVLVPAGASNIVSGDIAAKATVVSFLTPYIQPWQSVTLVNSWSVNQSVGYMKDPFGFVHLKGSIQAPASGMNSTAFTLPSGYRPAQALSITDGYFNSTAFTAGQVQISTSGVVSCVNNAAGTPNASTYFYFDGITFATF